MKTCTKCKTTQPLSSFTKKTSQPDGLDGWCKKCNRKARKKYYEANKEKLNKKSQEYQNKHREIIRIKRRERYERDKEIERAKSLERYHKNKVERGVYARRYWKKNKEKLCENNKKWKLNNQERINESRKIYTKKNKKKIAETTKTYREKNPEKIRKIKKDYLKNNREKVNKSRRIWGASEFGKMSRTNSRAKRRFLKMQTSDGSIPLKIRYPRTKELQELLDNQKNICYRPNCNTYISRELGNIHLDHKIPLEKGGTHTLGNVAWSCSTCNLRKGTIILDDDELGI